MVSRHWFCSYSNWFSFWLAISILTYSWFWRESAVVCCLLYVIWTSLLDPAPPTWLLSIDIQNEFRCFPKKEYVCSVDIALARFAAVILLIDDCPATSFLPLNAGIDIRKARFFDGSATRLVVGIRPSKLAWILVCCLAMIAWSLFRIGNAGLYSRLRAYDSLWVGM